MLLFFPLICCVAVALYPQQLLQMFFLVNTVLGTQVTLFAEACQHMSLATMSLWTHKRRLEN